jgi:hypothetical protein
MRADIRGQVGGGWALEIKTFLGPKMAEPIKSQYICQVDKSLCSSSMSISVHVLSKGTLGKKKRKEGIERRKNRIGEKKLLEERN